MCFCHKDTNYCLIVAVLPNFSQLRPQFLPGKPQKSQLAFANRPFLLVFQNARSVRASCRQQSPLTSYFLPLPSFQPSALSLHTSDFGLPHCGQKRYEQNNQNAFRYFISLAYSLSHPLPTDDTRHLSPQEVSSQTQGTSNYAIVLSLYSAQHLPAPYQWYQ